MNLLLSYIVFVAIATNVDCFLSPTAKGTCIFNRQELKSNTWKTIDANHHNHNNIISRKSHLFAYPLPFFATEKSEPIKEGKVSITTRLPLGKIFDSREYIFNTSKNVRGYEWTIKEAEELLDDLLDASNGGFTTPTNQSSTTTGGSSTLKQDYELNQIVLVPMEWDQDLYGLGRKFDVYDGQQRIITLTLIIAALRDSFRDVTGMQETVTELANMLNPPKIRKAEILRVELNSRDNHVMASILKGDTVAEDLLKHLGATPSSKKELSAKMSRGNIHIVENYGRIKDRLSGLSNEDRLQLLDFMIEKVYLLVCIPESGTIARNIVMNQGKGKDNEMIDEFKGLVCYRYIQDEKIMFKTFDRWDSLSSILDLDVGTVGRDVVSDACLLRATAKLRSKIRNRDQLYSLERWLRHDIAENQHDGSSFFTKHVEPASLALAQYREGAIESFGFYQRAKGTKLWSTIDSRLLFLRAMTKRVSSTKDAEIFILELLLQAGGGILTANGSKKTMQLNTLDTFLNTAELIVLWMVLMKPSAAQKYQKCFDFLTAIENDDTSYDPLSIDEKNRLREAFLITDFGSSAVGKYFALSLLKRLNHQILNRNGKSESINLTSDEFYLEPILPVKAPKSAWKESDWPGREEWMNRLGNLCLVSKKPTNRETKMSWVNKKKRYEDEVLPLTKNLVELQEWNSDSLLKNLAKVVNVIDSIWGIGYALGNEEE